MENNKNEKIIKCPKCHVNMGKMSNGKYIIDKCPKCKGIFLDGDELQNIKHISFFHYIKDYFRRGKHA
jgi:Zn-finger nucleic acid-binding protein